MLELASSRTTNAALRPKLPVLAECSFQPSLQMRSLQCRKSVTPRSAT
jgi:hypothetical protein